MAKTPWKSWAWPELRPDMGSTLVIILSWPPPRFLALGSSHIRPWPLVTHISIFFKERVWCHFKKVKVVLQVLQEISLIAYITACRYFRGVICLLFMKRHGSMDSHFPIAFKTYTYHIYRPWAKCGLFASAALRPIFCGLIVAFCLQNFAIMVCNILVICFNTPYSEMTDSMK